MQGFIEHFGDIPDPRVERTKKHKLIDILFLTLAAVLCGCDEWEEIQAYGEKKMDWLRKYIELSNGIPSHDTINRVISAINPTVMQERFVQWVQSIATLSEGQVVSLDGKRLCGSGKDGKEAIVHMVSAWSDANNLVLGSYKVDDKSNEITAIPKLLEMLDLAGCILTLDAMGCQTGIAEQIVDNQAHYILAVKENQAHLLDDIREAFAHEQPTRISTDVQTALGHGRIEKRTCRVITNVAWVCKASEWKGLASLVELTAERTDKKTGSYEKEVRYYISDLLQSAGAFTACIRSHWGIENRQHWALDVAFSEDKSRKRAGN
ncbi:MAG: ISAs1 family transposase, partial [Nitrososphaera sp.]|nr:ISAs1 family transposase [Nitrososphaera sp.]